MKNQKMYEADDKMISIIRDNYNILQSLGSFGINLGFGDKTVREVCVAAVPARRLAHRGGFAHTLFRGNAISRKTDLEDA